MKLSLELLFAYLVDTEPDFQNGFRIFSPAETDFTEKRISHIKFLLSTDCMTENDTLWFIESGALEGVDMSLLNGMSVVTCVDDELAGRMGDSGCICINVRDYGMMMLMFNAFMERFKTLMAWEKDTELLIARKAPLQKLVERAESIIDNPIFVWDGSFNIVGRPSGEVSELPLWQKWLEMGYIPGDGVAQFAKLGYFNNPEGYVSLRPISPLIFNYPFVIRVFSEGLRQELVFAQYFVRTPCTPALLELLNMLVEMLRQYVEEVMKTDKRGKNHIYEPFIEDIIQGRYSEDEIKDKLKYIKLPYEANYKVYIISFERYTKPLAVYVKRAVKQIAPQGHAIETNHMVCLLNKEPVNSGAEDGFREKLYEILENSSCSCGESDFVPNLLAVRDAAKQATAAIQMGMIVRPEERCWKYRDVYVYDMLFSYYRNMGGSYRSMIHPGLAELIRNDRANNNDNLKLLSIFLNSDRNITNTAKEMFLHRNTVIYRIGKIEQTLGVSLDDPDVRFDLLVSLKCIELKRLMEIQQNKAGK